jgi:hypothetical protein
MVWGSHNTNESRGHMENELFCELFNDNFLQQYITGSTHLGGNKLDLLLCNQPELIRDIRTLDHCDFPSDHFPVEFSITQTFSRAHRIRLNVYDFNHGRFKNFGRSYREHRLKWISQKILTSVRCNGKVIFKQPLINLSLLRRYNQ